MIDWERPLGIAFSFIVRQLYVISLATAAIFVDSLWLSVLLSVAGHTMQKQTDGEEEEDGKDECNCIPCLFLLHDFDTRQIY